MEQVRQPVASARLAEDSRHLVAASARSRHLVLPRARLQLRAAEAPADGVVGPDGAEGLEADVHGREGGSLGSPRGRRRPRLRALARRRRRLDLAGALPRRRSARRHQARPDARLRGRPCCRDRSARAARSRAPRRGCARRGRGRRRSQRLDHRPDRRDAELHARDPDLGDADRVRRPRRSRLGPGARPALVGRARRRRLRVRCPDPGLRHRPGRGRDAPLRAQPTRPRPSLRRVAPARLRRLLGAHARGRGSSRGRGRRARSRDLGHGRRGGDRRGGRRALHGAHLVERALRPQRAAASRLAQLGHARAPCPLRRARRTPSAGGHA